MRAPINLDARDQQAIGLALSHFLANRIEEGRAVLAGLRPEVLECLYTVGLRLGIEAQAMARINNPEPRNMPS